VLLIAIPHSFPKLFGTFAPTLAKNILTRMGVPFPLFAAYAIGMLKHVGGALLVIGLATRVVAALSFVEWAVITIFVAWPKGWMTAGGAEFVFVMTVLYGALAIGGAGPWSLDARLFG
jgi:putative oxidoreductase